MTAVALILDNTTPIQPVTEILVADTGDFCACDFRCDFVEQVFANSVGDGISNDFSDFLFRKVAATDTITIKLFRYKQPVSTITDDTLGTFFNGFTAQPLYVGWLADWTLIFNAFSGGEYQVKVTSVILGQTQEFVSRKFRLAFFDPELADRTVKIESIQDGNIVSSEFDFTDLLPDGWLSSIRLRGVFGEMAPTIEQDIFLDSSHRVTQNRDEIIREYSLRCEVVPETIFTRIASQDMIGNQVLISAFNVFNDVIYQKFPVTPDSFEEQEYRENGFLNFNIKFKDRQQNVIKRNF